MSYQAVQHSWKYDIPQGEKLVLLAYAQHANKNGKGMFPSARRISEMTGYDIRTVYRHLKALKEKRILREESRRRGGSVSYSLNLDDVVATHTKSAQTEGNASPTPDSTETTTDTTVNVRVTAATITPDTYVSRIEENNHNIIAKRKVGASAPILLSLPWVQVSDGLFELPERYMESSEFREAFEEYIRQGMRKSPSHRPTVQFLRSEFAILDSYPLEAALRSATVSASYECRKLALPDQLSIQGEAYSTNSIR